VQNRKFIDLKYKIAWYIGAIASFLLYFSGIVPLYINFRKRYFKQYITIILMYHRINDTNNDQDISVSPKNFKFQIKYLKRNFDVISLDELIKRLKQNYLLERDVVAITFDDGYKDNFTNAYPILEKYDIPATVFIITGLINQNSKMLSSEEIIKMRKKNITFGSHTVTHKVLSEIERDSALLEIRASKSVLEDILQEEIKYFAYPCGKIGRDFNEESIQMVKKTGYLAAFSTDNGCINRDSNLFALNRIGIRNFPLFVFKVRVSGFFENKWFYMLRKYLKLT
jgi:peptidoglycan/xylan/chitin deacetylase (PgdA/CDA1 family)